LDALDAIGEADGSGQFKQAKDTLLKESKDPMISKVDAVNFMVRRLALKGEG
jgi:hypothetical protein